MKGPADLLTEHGTLKPDPRYGKRRGDEGKPQEGMHEVGLVDPGPLRDIAWARFQALECGRSVQEIVDLFKTEGRRYSKRRVQRWVGEEVAFYRDQHAAVVGHPLVRELQKMRAAQIPQLARKMERLRRKSARRPSAATP